ncbi:hypothetical protein WAI453_013149 [Rhynchosporium graminicola]
MTPYNLYFVHYFPHVPSTRLYTQNTKYYAPLPPDLSEAISTAGPVKPVSSLVLQVVYSVKGLYFKPDSSRKTYTIAFKV